MKKQRKNWRVYLAIVIPAIWLLNAPGCKKKFEPPILRSNPNLLVIDGFLNNSPDTTIIRLSRTKKISDGTRNAAERGAQLYVETTNGTVLYNFQPLNDDGEYFVPGMSLDPALRYRLRIQTAGGSQYLSDDIEVKMTPPIDSVSWRRQEDGVMIYANTHDPSGNTKYYRWEYVETWEFHSTFFSVLIYENQMIRDRNFPEEQVMTCWTTQRSTDLLLASSAKLSQDIIYMKPVQFIPENTVQISVKYSILLKQFALTKEAFEYLENLKKITEEMGSIFDAQPSQLNGNIHSLSNPAEPVLGYITASGLETKRIFITNFDVRPWGFAIDCEDPREVPLDSLDYYFEYGAGYTPMEELRGPTGGVVAILGASTFCVDCTIRRGSNQRPSFWQ